MELRAFVAEAKKNTYPVSEGVTLPDGARELVYESGIFRYRDRYYGSTSFVGQEIVWQDGVPVWAMNYHGGIYERFRAHIDVPELIAFLKSVLREVPQGRPFRGLESFAQGNFVYHNWAYGPFPHFRGHEMIAWCGEARGPLSSRGSVLYRLVYHGGYVGDRGLG
ncbi:MAG: hypothetical protein A3D67_01745 [Candidatus Lloydbacteria bacterium RIFCSPHIGHO2_02_FULL_51_22]|uniref:DUF5680 domain-containing protein n=1 Tax=Candidatus Lloydbacteria bacterium RIFCSPHIGHO2_02_FULL_51_22 TaxID=1798663 RepID=A0A1G2DGF2_9BACT|nr:MAG: hypothetical protein A3D67_01745 [Candidatus Lloydbacteria bacterium RIFCSPHIGHO2_02_FULL_51_22]